MFFTVVKWGLRFIAETLCLFLSQSLTPPPPLTSLPQAEDRSHTITIRAVISFLTHPVPQPSSLLATSQWLLGQRSSTNAHPLIQGRERETGTARLWLTGWGKCANVKRSNSGCTETAGEWVSPQRDELLQHRVLFQLKRHMQRAWSDGWVLLRRHGSDLLTNTSDDHTMVQISTQGHQNIYKDGSLVLTVVLLLYWHMLMLGYLVKHPAHTHSGTHSQLWMHQHNITCSWAWNEKHTVPCLMDSYYESINHQRRLNVQHVP